jgi:hypothetical protein
MCSKFDSHNINHKQPGIKIIDIHTNRLLNSCNFFFYLIIYVIIRK